MKIIQISAVLDRHGSTDIFGLGEDSKIYVWDYSKNEWRVYARPDNH